MILYECAHLRLTFHVRLRLLEVTWLGAASSEEFRQTQQYILALAARHQVRAWLGDLRRMPPLHPLDQIWLQQHWFPQFLELGLEKLAVVNADDPFGRQNVEDVVVASKARQHPGRPETRYFNDAEQAREWVEKPIAAAGLPLRG
ncbi:STAS/SEC14 domain-containing protein [Hymenobacter busanensis]|uniref:STAS/SEC14 domain-containing protein n=1 Tax=Hymenobacter busanensis TaxID=2607656 RepID=A0A7L5A1D7_9BACT|nr:STAS/SEC14 domain-containing protein [Hymenobacter busanensis]KAA9333083.1 STAS/SEC14 domain-containing protein [Hymenobacter busanensis]QHJ08242.1 hypothetical protein GUY19_13465 [Hymenobacter busanensis]